MQTNFNVSGFTSMLDTASQVIKNKEQKEKIPMAEKVYLNFPKNFGRYQMFPMTNPVTGLPFTNWGSPTREVKIMRPGKEGDSYEAWIRILPANAYVMSDQSGRQYVSSLTADDERVLNDATTIFDELWAELDAGSKQTDGNQNPASAYVRKRNYTLFQGKVINYWSKDNPRQASRSNFPALFVCTAKGFLEKVKESTESIAAPIGGDTSWLSQVYEPSLSGRTGYLIFSISRGDGGSVGYNITVNQEFDKGQYTKDYPAITEDEAALMQDPLENFLGWQAGKEEPGKLFNKSLMLETISYMTQMISKIRFAKSNGTSIQEAWEAAVKTAVMTAPQEPAPTADPFLSSMSAGPSASVNNIRTTASTIDPLRTPPAAQINPVTQAPEAPKAAPYSGFGGGGWNMENSGDPFHFGNK